MRLLRLNAYFTPELTAGNHLFNDLLESFAQNDIQCICITPDPTRGISDDERKAYKKKRKEFLYNGHVKVERFSMFKEGKNPLQRAFRYFLCSIIEYRKGIHTKNIDVVFSSSTPPTQGMISAMVAQKLSKKYGKKVPFVYNLQDVFPDSLVNSGMTKKGSLIWKIGRKIEDYTYSHADEIIVISNTMKDNILAKGVPEAKVHVVSNWIDLDEVKPIPRSENVLFKKHGFSEDDFLVVYAGNFGEAQGAEIILDVAEELKKYKKIKFVIFGGGTYFQRAKQRAESMENVFIHKLLPQEYVSQVYSLGDVALITCKPGTGSAGMPSKTWSIMACNTPIIASFDKDSELAYILEISKSGKQVDAEDKIKLKNMILEYYIVNINSDNKKRTNARDYIEKYVDKRVCVERYMEILTNIH